MRVKPISLQIRNANDVNNAIQPPLGCQDQKNKQKQTGKVKVMEENDWRTDVKISDNHSTYRAESLNMVSELQHTKHRPLGWIRAAKHGIELASAEEHSINRAF